MLLPARDRFAWQAYEKVGRRQSLAIAVVSFAGLLRLADDQRVAEVHLAWGSAGPTVPNRGVCGSLTAATAEVSVRP